MSKYTEDGAGDLGSSTKAVLGAFGALSGLSLVAFIGVSVLFIVFGGWILIIPLAIIGLLGFICWMMVAAVLTYAHDEPEADENNHTGQRRLENFQDEETADPETGQGRQARQYLGNKMAYLRGKTTLHTARRYAAYAVAAFATLSVISLAVSLLEETPPLGAIPIAVAMVAVVYGVAYLLHP